jgi:hypothetical protein
MAGNHDIGFGDSLIRSSAERFKRTFGPLNFNTTIAGHSIIVLDTLSLSATSDVRDEAMAFLGDVSSYKDDRPVILFTHVPLYRPNTASCGVSSRMTSNIYQGAGYQYQNLVEPTLTQLILESIKPEFVFSGDDHDQCSYTHTLKAGDTVSEYTVGTFSWLQGNKRPSFGQLILVPHSKIPGNDISTEFRVCYLPSQFNIYYSYIFAAILSAIIFALDSFRIFERCFGEPSLVMYSKKYDRNPQCFDGFTADLKHFLRSAINALVLGLSFYGLIITIDINL